MNIRERIGFEEAAGEGCPKRPPPAPSGRRDFRLFSEKFSGTETLPEAGGGASKNNDYGPGCRLEGSFSRARQVCRMAASSLSCYIKQVSLSCVTFSPVAAVINAFALFYSSLSAFNN